MGFLSSRIRIAIVACLVVFSAPALCAAQEDTGQETEPEIVLEDDLVGNLDDLAAFSSDGDGEMALLAHAASFQLPAVELRWTDKAGQEQVAYGWGRLFWDTKDSSWRGNNWSRGHAAAWVTKTKHPKGERLSIDEIGIQFFFLRSAVPRKGPKVKANASSVSAGWDSGKGHGSFRPGQICAKRSYKVAGKEILPTPAKECRRLF